MWTLCLTILVVALVAHLWLRRRIYWLYWKLKGPVGYPLEGVSGGKYTFDAIKRQRVHHTPIIMWFGANCGMRVSDPYSVQKILKAPQCMKKPGVYECITRTIGDGLLSSNNPKWAAHRKLLNPVMNNRNLMSFFTIFNAKTDVLRSKMQKYADTGKSCRDLFELFASYTLDTACQTIMRTSINIQTDENNEIQRAYNDTIKSAAKMIFNPIYRYGFFTKIYDVKFHESRKNAIEVLDKFVKSMVLDNLHGQEPASVDTEENSDDLTKPVSLFIDYMKSYLQRKLFTLTDVLDESNHILIAAYETSATTLLNIVTLLAIHPEWQEKLYEEIKQVFPGKDFEVQPEDLKDVPLAEMIINESLRLLPVIPIQAREATADFQLNEDITIPKGLVIGVDVYNLHRDPEHWGPDACDFNPYHFLPDAVKNRHPYCFVPISKGYRNCLGWRYAYLLLKVCLIKVFRSYRFTTTTKMEELDTYFNITSKLLVEPEFEIHSRLE